MQAYIKSQRFLCSGTTRFLVFSGHPENHPNNNFLDSFPTRRMAERYAAASGYELVKRGNTVCPDSEITNGKDADLVGKYNIKIRETLEMTVTVEAGSMAQAKEVAERGYKNSEYVLDASHYKGVTFQAVHPEKNCER